MMLSSGGKKESPLPRGLSTDQVSGLLGGSFFPEKQCLHGAHISTRRKLLVTDLLTLLNLVAQEASDYLPEAALPAEWSQRARVMTIKGGAGAALRRAGFWTGGLQGTQLTSQVLQVKGEFVVAKLCLTVKAPLSMGSPRQEY